MQIHVDDNLELTERGLAGLRDGDDGEATDPGRPAAPPRRGRLWRLARRLLGLAALMVLFLELGPPACLGQAGRARWTRGQDALGERVAWPAVHSRGLLAANRAERALRRAWGEATSTARAARERWEESGRCRAPAPRPLSEARHWQVMRGRVNVRDGPAATHAATGQLGEGTIVEVTGPPDGRWIPILLPSGRRGWVHGDLGRGLGRIPCPVQAKAGRRLCARRDPECQILRRTTAGERLAEVGPVASAGGGGPGRWIPVDLGGGEPGWLAPD